MSRWAKVILGIVFSFMVCFLAVGYAQLTDTLSITGSAQASAEESVFVTDAVMTSGSGSGIKWTKTIVTSTVDLGASASATMRITVYNNTDIVYGYNTYKYAIGDGYDNENIKITPSIAKRTEVAPGESLEFDVVFTYVSGSSATDSSLYSVIDYEFLPLDEIPEDDAEVAANGVMERFREILNDTDGDYKTLTDHMDKGDENNRNETYVGNVVGATAADIALLEDLFVGDLHINIGGVDTDVTIMIKREDLTGDGVAEMTVYMTTDDLQLSFWEQWTGAYAPVYVAVFTQDTTGEWIQIGDMFEGEAQIVNYSTGFSGSGSINTDTWRSTSGQTIEQVVEQTGY
ncbi:MAG: hypothetical protein IJY08_00495 [Clostridia bacterium]|nr:hypothetical protein [Clostridia bacterium]